MFSTEIPPSNTMHNTSMHNSRNKMLAKVLFKIVANVTINIFFLTYNNKNYLLSGTAAKDSILLRHGVKSHVTIVT